MHIKVCCLLLCGLLCIVAGCDSSARTPQSPAPPQQVEVAQAQPAATISPNSNQTAIEQQPTTGALSGSMKGKIDACTLLTSSDIQTVQAETVKEKKSSEQYGNAFVVTQCFYVTTNFAKSVSLLLAQKDLNRPGAQSPKDFLNERLRRATNAGAERENESGRAKEQRGEEETESKQPQRVSGIGDDAYWMGNRVGGALYVLKKDGYIRISIGGQDDDATKIKKTKMLAQRALQRLQS